MIHSFILDISFSLQSLIIMKNGYPKLLMLKCFEKPRKTKYLSINQSPDWPTDLAIDEPVNQSNNGPTTPPTGGQQDRPWWSSWWGLPGRTPWTGPQTGAAPSPAPCRRPPSPGWCSRPQRHWSPQWRPPCSRRPRTRSTRTAWDTRGHQVVSHTGNWMNRTLPCRQSGICSQYFQIQRNITPYCVHAHKRYMRTNVTNNFFCATQNKM